MDQDEGKPVGDAPDEQKKLKDKTKSFKQACQQYVRMRARSGR